MNDTLPEQTPYWQWIEDNCRQTANAYAYREIRLPLLEQTDLFHRTIGEDTDIVEKEMYTFADRNGDSLSLRPEGTASCVRAGIQQGMFHNQVQRLWYLGPMFRHERPQKGRYRQFHQFGMEAIGMSGPEVDAELIFFVWRLWRKLGVCAHMNLQINTLGRQECRSQYRQRLIDFYQQRYHELDEDSRRRLVSNPLRILDSKNPQIIALNQYAPSLVDHLDPPSQHHFTRLCDLLTAAQIPYQINPRLVRGLDYYEHTVFEWVNEDLGSQATVCAGGRYDCLIEQLGGQPTSAAGFAIGLERLVALATTIRQCTQEPDIFLILVGDAAIDKGMLLAELLREELPQLSVMTNLVAGNFKSQIKRADKSGARLAVIIGEDELSSQTVSVKELRHVGAQHKLPVSSLVDFIKREF